MHLKTYLAEKIVDAFDQTHVKLLNNDVVEQDTILQ